MGNKRSSQDLDGTNTKNQPHVEDPAELCHADRLLFETLLTEIATGFVNLPIDEIDAAIEESQRRICEYLHLDRSMLWQIVQTDPIVTIQSHAHSSIEDKLPASPFTASENTPWILGQILQGKTVAIVTEKDIPPDADQDHKIYSLWGLKSALVLPLSIGGDVIGALSFGCLRQEAAWPAGVINRLQLIAQLFTNALVRKQSSEMWQIRLKFEKLLNELSARFISLPASQIDLEIENALHKICDFLDIDMSVLFQWTDEAHPILTVTHVHSPPGGPERPERMDAREAFPWAIEQVMSGEVLELHTEKLPPEAAIDQEVRRMYGVQSSVIIPLSMRNGKIIGAVTFDDLKEDRAWPEQIVKELGMVAQIFTNALARKRGDLKLRESEARLNMVTNAAGVGLWMMKIGTGDIWATGGAREIFQISKDEPIDYDFFLGKLHPDDRERVETSVNRSVRTDAELNLEYRIMLPRKSIRWVAVSGKRSLKENGEPDRLMGVVIDVNERKEMEEKLHLRLQEIAALKQKLEKENKYLREEIENTKVHKDIVARSSVMKLALAQAEKVARTDTTVLIEGETGTGKEMMARAVHRLSLRNSLPLVTVNCASLPPTLVESELFGREKGAYTGAMTRMTGRFELAHGGTLFLDEIGELPIEVQAKLLRVLEEGCFERLGSTKSINVDVRIVAATNQNLEKQVNAGKFRKDLYYRLNVFPIHLPPLRERPEDIPPLFWNFVKQYEKKLGKRIDNVPRHCMDDLQRYEWPGNVRELRNVIERALIVSSGRTLEVHPLHKGTAKEPRDYKLEDVERRHIEGILLKVDWRISGKGGAAEVLGLKRTTLNARIKKLGIKRPSR